MWWWWGCLHSELCYTFCCCIDFLAQLKCVSSPGVFCQAQVIGKVVHSIVEFDAFTAFTQLLPVVQSLQNEANLWKQVVNWKMQVSITDESIALAMKMFSLKYYLRGSLILCNRLPVDLCTKTALHAKKSLRSHLMTFVVFYSRENLRKQLECYCIEFGKFQLSSSRLDTITMRTLTSSI